MLGYIESFIIMVLVYFMIYQIFLRKRDQYYKIRFSIFYLYLYLVMCVTILPIDFTFDPKWKYHSSINFTYVHMKPFHDLISG